MERHGVSSIKPHLRKVYQDSSWEGSAPAILDHIPADNEIEGLYDIYTDRPVVHQHKVTHLQEASLAPRQVTHLQEASLMITGN
jgi:hypothetical protein